MSASSVLKWLLEPVFLVMGLVGLLLRALRWLVFGTLGRLFLWLSAGQGNAGDADMVRPLGDTELKELAHLMASRDPSLGTLADLNGLDGFLTCVAVGPDLIRPSEWIELIFAAGLGSTSGKQYGRACQLMTRRMNTILAECAQEPPAYRPLMQTHPTLGDREIPLDLWCRGFTVAAVLRDREWQKLLRKKESASWLRPIWSRADAGIYEAQGRKFPAAKAAEAAALNLEGIKAAVLRLRSSWAA